MTFMPAPIAITTLAATSATTDEQLVASWVASLNSDHTRRNFETTANRFMAALGKPLRQVTVEDVRDALSSITAGLAATSARQIILRVKSLLSYGHKLGYLPFNAGVVIKVQSEARSVAQRIVTEVEISLLIRGAPTKRDRVLIEIGYAAGLRVSELVGLSWADVIERQDGKVQLDVLGKGGKRRQVLLPDVVGRSLLVLRGEAGADDRVFRSRKGGHRLTERAVNHMLKRAAASAGIFAPTLRHHDGLFWLVTTNVSTASHVIYTAEDPRGPWSDRCGRSPTGGRPNG
jgi:integrase/recombinase XerD